MPPPTAPMIQAMFGLVFANNLICLFFFWNHDAGRFL